LGFAIAARASGADAADSIDTGRTSALSQSAMAQRD
jgi:hypothetical protein